MWFKKANPESYLDIGHDFDEKTNRPKGNNILWVLFDDGSFKWEYETDMDDSHESLNLIDESVVYKGRIDTEKRIASIIGIYKCQENINPIRYKTCEKLKMAVITKIHNIFGNDIKMRLF